MEEMRSYTRRISRILKVIGSTGNGSEEHPFYVTSVSDEYMFMRLYLDIWDISKQYATEKFDVIELNKTSEYYSKKTIYFEITRVLEMEHGMFQN